ncbi:MAG TPA: response regulator transcription factor [Elusimicrobiales bacterium]|nr:response regulator transcription factor [Elusimicrobiales bacterium]
MKPKILIIDDEIGILRAVAEKLEAEHYDVLTCTTAEQALMTMNREIPDLLIVDIRLPGMNGFDFCKKVRAMPQPICSLPLIYLTTTNTEASKITGLELGGDDYITKPFSPSELVARIRALLRRTVREGSEEEEELTAADGKLNLNIAKHEVRLDAKQLDLPPKEFDLLLLLLRKKTRVLTRQFIMESVWGRDYENTTRTIDTHIKQLRQNLGKYGKMIKTVEGLGYKWDEE